MAKHKHTSLLHAAFKTSLSHTGFLVISPLASLVGLAALIDAVLYAVIMLLTYTGALAIPTVLPNIGSLAEQAFAGASPSGIVWRMVAILVALLLGVFAQAAIVHVTYRHAKRRKVSLKHAFSKSLIDLPAVIGLHIVSLTVTIASTWATARIIFALGAAPSAWILVPIFLLFALWLFVIMSFKLIALQQVVGRDQSLFDAMHDTVEMIRHSWKGILEYNAALICVNIILLSVLYTVGVIVALMVTILATLIALALDVTLSPYAIGIITTILSFSVAGIATLYNLAAWSHLVHKLEKRQVPSRFVNWFKKQLHV